MSSDFSTSFLDLVFFLLRTIIAILQWQHLVLSRNYPSYLREGNYDRRELKDWKEAKVKGIKEGAELREVFVYRGPLNGAWPSDILRQIADDLCLCCLDNRWQLKKMIMPKLSSFSWPSFSPLIFPRKTLAFRLCAYERCLVFSLSLISLSLLSLSLSLSLVSLSLSLSLCLSLY